MFGPQGLKGDWAWSFGKIIILKKIAKKSSQKQLKTGFLDL